jgi:2,4-dienoyl-CoA reductase (NADPH2)
VVVVDDGFGWWPCVSAVELAVAGGAARIAVLAPAGAFATGIPAEARIQLMPRLEGARLETHSFLVPVAVGPDGVTAKHRFSNELQRIAADVVIFVGERQPAAAGVQLPPTARAQTIGDAVVPRRASHAIAEGRAAAEAILAELN